MEIGSALTDKLGPLPGYVWAALVVGGAYAFRALKGRRGVGGAATATSPVSDTTAQTAPVDPLSGLPAPTNGSWASSAANHLIGAGAYSATDVSNALYGYLNGTSLTQAQSDIAALAVHSYGIPPEGVLPINVAPPIPYEAPYVAPASPYVAPIPQPYQAPQVAPYVAPVVNAYVPYEAPYVAPTVNAYVAPLVAIPGTFTPHYATFVGEAPMGQTLPAPVTTGSIAGSYTGVPHGAAPL